jgi:hypothetical protein
VTEVLDLAATRCACGAPAFRRSRLCETHYREAMTRVAASLTGKRPGAQTIKHSEPRLTAEELSEQRAAAAGRYVQANGPKPHAEVARAVGVSPRTLTRLLPYAIEQGYVTRVIGSAGGIAPGPQRP